MIQIFKLFNSFAILRPPIPLKKPPTPVSAGSSSMSPSVLAQKFNIS